MKRSPYRSQLNTVNIKNPTTFDALGFAYVILYYVVNKMINDPILLRGRKLFSLETELFFDTYKGALQCYRQVRINVIRRL